MNHKFHIDVFFITFLSLQRNYYLFFWLKKYAFVNFHGFFLFIMFSLSFNNQAKNMKLGKSGKIQNSLATS